MASVEPIVDAIYNVTVSHLDAEFDVFQLRLQQQIQSMLAQGISSEEIQQRLLTELQAGTGLFGEFQNSLESVGTKGINQVSNNVANELVHDEGDKFEWVYEPTAEHCATCEERNGQVKTYDEWVEQGLPGAGTTDCTIYCKCTLMPV